MPHHFQQRFLCFIAALLMSCAAGCLSTDRVDRSVQRQVLRAVQAEGTGLTNAAADAMAQMAIAEATPPPGPITLDRATALRLASRYSRDLQDRRDALYADALVLFAARRSFEIQYSGTADYVLTRNADGDETRVGSVQAGATRVLPTGATVKFTGETSVRDSGGSNGNTYASAAGVRLDQPLLAGAGYEASHDPMIQAERDYTYALRAFALERQDFALGVVRDYFDLVRQQSVVSNLLLNLQQFSYLRQRTEALFQVRRAPAIDVLRAQQQELSATNQVSTAQESYKIQIGRFLVQLGLPGNLACAVVADVPELSTVLEDQERAVALALSLRPDVQTVRDRLVDAERALRVSRNAYLPQLGLFGTIDTAGEGDKLGGSDFEDASAAGIVLELPFDRRDRRDAVKLASMRLASARRGWQQKQDEIALDIADNYSQLRSLTKTIDIQHKNLEIAEKRAENANFLFKTGELSNRDVVEAQNELLSARNALVSAFLDYEIQRLRLLRNVGLLDVAPDGSLIELRPDRPAEVHP